MLFPKNMLSTKMLLKKKFLKKKESKSKLKVLEEEASMHDFFMSFFLPKKFKFSL